MATRLRGILGTEPISGYKEQKRAASIVSLRVGLLDSTQPVDRLVRSGTTWHGRSGTKTREIRNDRFVRLAGIARCFRPPDGLNSLTQKRNKISLLVVNVCGLWITSFPGGKKTLPPTSRRRKTNPQCTTSSQVSIKAIRGFSGGDPNRRTHYHDGCHFISFS
jgi:hypothetical protein